MNGQNLERSKGFLKRNYPKTDAERRATHKRLYGNSKLPPRGTGRNQARLEAIRKIRRGK